MTYSDRAKYNILEDELRDGNVNIAIEDIPEHYIHDSVMLSEGSCDSHLLSIEFLGRLRGRIRMGYNHFLIPATDVMGCKVITEHIVPNLRIPTAYKGRAFIEGHESLRYMLNEEHDITTEFKIEELAVNAYNTEQYDIVTAILREAMYRYNKDNKISTTTTLTYEYLPISYKTLRNTVQVELNLCDGVSRYVILLVNNDKTKLDGNNTWEQIKHWGIEWKDGHEAMRKYYQYLVEYHLL